MSLISGKELITYQDRLYWIYRKVKFSSIKEGYVNDVKIFWNCDLVVRSRNQNDETLLFLREIEEAKIVKDII
jgi:hypothetical protein